MNLKPSSIISYLNDIDTQLFLYFNGIHSPNFDIIFGYITSKTFWIPMYVVLLFFTVLKFKWKTFYVGLFIGLLFLIADQSSVKLFKEMFERLRPSHEPSLEGLVHVVTGKGGQYGFVSSHAANSFALAIFSGFLLKKHYKYLLIIMLFWASLVSYSRVYVGVHYPGDILGGAILGCIVGFLVFWLMKVVNRKFNLKIENI